MMRRTALVWPVTFLLSGLTMGLAGAPAGSADQPGDSGPPLSKVTGDDPLVVFVTSTTYNGDLLTSAGDYGYPGSDGLEAGDWICTQLAADAGLTGFFTAWLSTDAVDVENRFFRPGGPWYRTDGVLVAYDVGDLLDCTDPSCVRNPITLTELGTVVLEDVWTNTDPDGTRFGNDTDCDSWRHDACFTSSWGAGGRSENGSPPGTIGWWTKMWHGWSCCMPRHLYCFQQRAVAVEIQSFVIE